MSCLVWCGVLLSLFLTTMAQAITVTVAWDYGTNGQDGFQLLRCTGSSCSPSSALSLSIGPTVRQIGDSTVAGGTSYCYSVMATLTGNPSSAASNTLCVSVPTPGLATHLTFTTPPQPSTFTNQAMNTVVLAVRDDFEQTVAGSTASITVALPSPTEAAIPQSQLALVSVDSQETVCENAPGTQAIDANINTYWHTAWCSTIAALPHTIIVDLSASYNVTGFKYLPRQDWGDGTAGNGGIAGYQFSVSTDGSNWGSVAASGTFANTVAEKTATFMGRTGRYVRLVATSEVFGQQFTSVAELTTLQTPTGAGALTCAGGCTGNASAGVRSVPGLSVNQAGSYTLQASASGLTGASAPFTVIDLPPSVQVPYIVRVGR